MSEGYNGWSNYETWCCKLWLDNDEGTYRAVLDMARDAAKDADGETLEDKRESAANDLCGTLEDFVQSEMLPDLGCSFAADILGAAFSEIDFQEIAESIIGDLDADDFDLDLDDDDDEEDEDETETPE